MPSPEQIRDAGPWAVLAFVLLTLGVFFWRAFQQKSIVPGWIFQRAEAREETTAAQVDRTIRILEAMGESIKASEASQAATSAAVRDLVLSVRELTAVNQSLSQSFQAMARSYDSIERRVDDIAVGRVKNE